MNLVAIVIVQFLVIETRIKNGLRKYSGFHFRWRLSSCRNENCTQSNFVEKQPRDWFDPIATLMTVSRPVHTRHVMMVSW